MEWDRRDNGVHCGVSAFSRPAHGLAGLGPPLVRRSQDRFGGEEPSLQGQSAAAHLDRPGGRGAEAGGDGAGRRRGGDGAAGRGRRRRPQAAWE